MLILFQARMRNSCLKQAPEKSNAISGGASSSNKVLAAEGILGAVGTSRTFHVSIQPCGFLRPSLSPLS